MAPFEIKDLKNKTWIFKSIVNCPGEKFFLYQLSDDHAFISRVLTPSKIESEYVREKSINSNYITQTNYDCALAALSNLSGVSLEALKAAATTISIPFDSPAGIGDDELIEIAATAGIKLQAKDYIESEPFIFTLPSLNIKGSYHKLMWNGERIVDSNQGIPGRKWWGSEWALEDIKPYISDILTLA